MITRREVFSISVVPLAAAITSSVQAASIPYFDDFDSCLNLEGKKCEWSKQLAKDILNLHNFHVRDLFEYSYATSFTITKEVLNDNGISDIFTLERNDERDMPFCWVHYEKKPMTRTPESFKEWLKHEQEYCEKYREKYAKT